MPAKRTVCRACAALTNKHRRRNAGRILSSRAERMIDRPGAAEAAWRACAAFVVLSGRRETHFRYLWNTRCECRAGSKCAVVFADFVFGRLPKLHLRHVRTVSGRSGGEERVLHSKLDIPTRLASHSAALAWLFYPILFRLALHRWCFSVSA